MLVIRAFLEARSSDIWIAQNGNTRLARNKNKKKLNALPTGRRTMLRNPRHDHCENLPTAKMSQPRSQNSLPSGSSSRKKERQLNANIKHPCKLKMHTATLLPEFFLAKKPANDREQKNEKPTVGTRARERTRLTTPDRNRQGHLQLQSLHSTLVVRTHLVARSSCQQKRGTLRQTQGQSDSTGQTHMNVITKVYHL